MIIPDRVASRRDSESTGLRQRLSQQLLERIDPQALGQLPAAQVRAPLRTLIHNVLSDSALPLNQRELRELADDLEHEVLGLGPLEPLLADPTVCDILVNGSEQIYVERHGKLELTSTRFDDTEHLLRIIDRIVSRVGRRVDEASPMVDARLADGSRANAIIPPLAVDGPVLSIRKFSRIPLRMSDLLRFGALTEDMAVLIQAMVQAKLNVLISGGTGSGKTTMLNVMSGFISPQERIVTLEDAAELQLQQPHVVRLETRPPNLEGQGEVTQRALLRNALRMRPDRIILGEVRADEVLDMLQAMNTGHDGSMATVHANSARDALMRIENMVGMAGAVLPSRSLRTQIASALSAVIQLQRLPDGQRCVTSLSEVVGMEGDVITLQEIFTFERLGMGPDGRVLGRFKPTGVRPQFHEQLLACGLHLSDALYRPAAAVAP